VSPSSTERQTLALQRTITQATNIDETRQTASMKDNEGESSGKSKTFQSLEIDSGSGTENRRAKRRKAKKNTPAQSTEMKPDSSQFV